MHDTRHKFSILRDAEYVALGKVQFLGAVLDIGGSTKSGYHELMKGAGVIHTANIDPSYGCDLVFDIEKPFPIEEDTYDGVVAINVLEHIYAFHNVITETYRVLRPRGIFVCAVPFMFHVHGSPDDYFRYTKSCLARLCTEAGFSDVLVEELGGGVCSLVFQIIGGAIPFRPLRHLSKRASVGADRFLARISKRYQGLSQRIPLGYFVVARKS